MRDTFVLYSNYCDILSSTSLEDAGAIFKAILNYVKHGVVIELPPHLTLAFGFIKNQLDIDEEKYNQKIEKLRANGHKGGRSKKNELEEIRHCDDDDITVGQALPDNSSDLTNNSSVANARGIGILSSEGEENGSETQQDQYLTTHENTIHDSPLTSHVSHLTNKKDVTDEERDFLISYIMKNYPSIKNVDAYLYRIIQNGDHKRILKEEFYKNKPKMSREERIQAELATVHDKRSAARVLAPYYSETTRPPKEFDEIMLKYDLDTYEKIGAYSWKVARLIREGVLPPPAPHCCPK